MILLLSNIAVPVLGSSMYGTCTETPVRVAAVQGAAALLILHESEVRADEAIDLINTASSPPSTCAQAGTVHAAGKLGGEDGPRRQPPDTALSTVTHLEGAPLLCEEGPPGAVPGNTVIQVRQLKLCQHLRYSHAASSLHRMLLDVCSQPCHTLIAPTTACMCSPQIAITSTGVITWQGMNW